MKYKVVLKKKLSKQISQVFDELENVLFIITEKNKKSVITDNTGNELYNASMKNAKSASVYDGRPKRSVVDSVVVVDHENYYGNDTSIKGNILQYKYDIIFKSKVAASIYPNEEANNSYIIDVKEELVPIKKVVYLVALVDILTTRKKGSLTGAILKKNNPVASKNN